jgi:hypothetical protein
MGRFVRPQAGLSHAPAGDPIRLLDEDGRIVGIGAVDGKRIAPAKMLPLAVAKVAGHGPAARPGDAVTVDA